MTAFSRFHALMALTAAALSNAAAVGQHMTHAQAVDASGGYRSRGKGKTAKHDGGGSRAFQRMAMKRRNRAAHRKACR